MSPAETLFREQLRRYRQRELENLSRRFKARHRSEIRFASLTALLVAASGALGYFVLGPASLPVISWLWG